MGKAQVSIYRNKNGYIYGFTAENHTDSIVCAALSILTLNTINSIEAFADEDFNVELDEKKGLIDFSLPFIKNGLFNEKVNLLLNSYLLGIKGIESEYSSFLNVIDGGA